MAEEDEAEQAAREYMEEAKTPPGKVAKDARRVAKQAAEQVADKDRGNGERKS